MSPVHAVQYVAGSDRSAFDEYVSQKWRKVVKWLAVRDARVLKASEISIAVCAVGILFIYLPDAIRRHFNSWRAGLSTFQSVPFAIWIFMWLTASSLAAWVHASFGLICLAIVVSELRRNGALADAKEQIANAELGLDDVDPESVWQATSADTPIRHFHQDLLGRRKTVCQLREMSLTRKIPIIALTGELGSGKSSTLNLLCSTLKNQAIPVAFNAWLPANSEILVAELLSDIATECGKHVRISKLKKSTRAFARTISGSFKILGGIKELVPKDTQREEIQSLNKVLSRLPMRVVVLVDEIDRMDKSEIFVLLKILRGSHTLSNITFVCAFDEKRIKSELGIGAELPSNYLDKFFPCVLRLSPPDTQDLLRWLLPQLEASLPEDHWFKQQDSREEFRRHLGEVWEPCLERLCGNLRNLNIVVDAVANSASILPGEIDVIDLVLLSALGRFCAPAYELLERQGILFAKEGGPTQLVQSDKPKLEFDRMEDILKSEPEQSSLRNIIALLFPKYAAFHNLQFVRHYRAKPQDAWKRVDNPAILAAFFRGKLPIELSRSIDLEQFLAACSPGANLTEHLSRIEDELPAARRAHLFGRVASSLERLSDSGRERLAVELASYPIRLAGESVFASSYSSSIRLIISILEGVNGNERLRIVQKVFDSAKTDRFVRELLDAIEHQFGTSSSDERSAGISARGAFNRWMSVKYSAIDSPVALKDLDWPGVRRWVHDSEENMQSLHKLLKQQRPKEELSLTAFINFVYPAEYFWSENPEELVDRIFPIDELLVWADEIEPKSDTAREAVLRLRNLKNGKYPHH